jgi:WD40 repeat protein
MLASGSADRTLRFWSLASGECTKTIPAHQDWVTALAFAAEDKLLVSGSLDGTIKLWSVPEGTAQGSLTVQA